MTGRRSATVVTAVVLVLVVGCATTDHGSSGETPADESSLPEDPPAAPQASPPAGQPAPPGAGRPEPVHDDPAGPAVSPAPIEPTAGVVDARPTPIDNVVSDPDSAVLEVWFWNEVAPCAALERVDVHETDAEVRITVFTGSVGGTPSSCPAPIALHSSTVTLSSPLGARPIDDGATR